MDILAAKLGANMAKSELAESGRIGSVEYKGVGIVYDNDPTGKDTIDGALLETVGTFVHVSDLVIQSDRPTKIILFKTIVGGTVVYTSNNIKPIITTDGLWIVVGELTDEGNDNEVFDERILALSFGSDVAALIGVAPGTYFYTDIDNGLPVYVSSLSGQLTETLHPIDHKYLPGVCLPVVIDLSSYSVEGQTLEEIVAGYVLSGGGKFESSTIPDKLFENVNTDGHLFIKFNFGTSEVMIRAVTTVADSGLLSSAQINAIGVVYYGTSGNVITAAVSIAMSGDNFYLVVKVI